MGALADPIVRVKLKEFRVTVDALIAAKYMTDGDRATVVRELCELSRNTKFDLGPVRFADVEQSEEVAACFEKAVTEIRQLWAVGKIPDEVARYCENIERRASRCRVAH
jgi:hypothetical protein